jgi:uncharacterized protein (TIGR00255 family)
MIRSMTGYGKAVTEWANKKISIEIRSLNSKQFDLNLRLPGLYKEKELDIRSLLMKEAERGRIDVSIFVEAGAEERNVRINQELAKNYFEDLSNISRQLDIKCEIDYLSLIMRMPDIMKAEKPELDESEWDVVEQGLNQALLDFNKFRLDEGLSLGTELRERIHQIQHLLEKVVAMDSERITNIKERIKKNLDEVVDSNKFDNNRFEQELIYYIEKLDITEEKLRLKTHCKYFLDTMHSTGAEGRKLGFIAQEIGREINTIGSKANNAEIQKHVVEMKDELEKIKEQLLNVL